MAMYTVKQLAALSGVTPRALRYYHKIGLLEPTRIGANGYRYYGDDALYRLQQILFYRELGMPLAQIRRVIVGRDFDLLQALQRHRAALTAEAKRIRTLIRTIDRTAKGLEGGPKMKPTRLFEGFSDEAQEQFSREAASRWDSVTVRASNGRWQRYSPQEKQSILDEGKSLYADLAAAMPKGPGSPAVQEIIGRWRLHLEHFWTPSDEQLIGLTDLYNEDPRFRRNYEETAPGLAAFMREAVRAYVKGRQAG